MSVSDLSEAELDLASVPATARATPRPLGRLALRGSFWAIGGFGAGQVLRFAGSLILTRLLVPDALGTMAVVNAFVLGLQMFSDVGLLPSIVRHERGDDPAFLNTAWTIQVMRGTALWLCTWLAAWPAAALYDDEQLRWLLPVAGIGNLLAGFNSTAIFTCRRHMVLTRITLLDLSCQAIGLAVVVVLAWIHPSVWAMVFGSLAAAAAKSVASHLVLRGIRQRFCWDRESRLALFTFGRWIFLNTLIGFCAMHADKLVLGRIETWANLGVYTTAVLIAHVPRTLLQNLSISVVYPLFSKVRHDLARFRRTVGRARTAMLLFAAPMCAAMLAAGDLLVRVAYDPRYEIGGNWLRIAAVGVWLEALTLTYGKVIMAAGRPAYMTAGSAVKTVVFLACVVPVHSRLGLAGVAGLAGASEVCALAAAAVGAKSLGALKLAGDLGLTIWFLAVAGADWLVCQALVQHTGSDWAGLAGLTAVSAVAMGVTWVFIRASGNLAARGATP